MFKVTTLVEEPVSMGVFELEFESIEAERAS
jgi:hypothetical protein